MARPKGSVVAAADRRMREARERWLLRGEGTLAEFAEAMDAFSRWDLEHGHTTATGATGLPDLEEYDLDRARDAPEELPGPTVGVGGADPPPVPEEAGSAPSTPIRRPPDGDGESTARLLDPVTPPRIEGVHDDDVPLELLETPAETDRLALLDVELRPQWDAAVEAEAVEAFTRPEPPDGT